MAQNVIRIPERDSMDKNKALDAALQQADVPSRGTFYRVRVGPFASADAQRLCDDLKSAGGDCVLARR